MIFLAGQPIDVTIFPDKTSQVWKISPKFLLNAQKYGSISVRWDFQHESEFMHLAQLKMLLDSMSTDYMNLYLPYLPYGRQDKSITNTTTFALVAFAGLLNSLRFDEVVITDPHSSRALNLIHNSRAQYPVGTLADALYVTKNNIVCYPDKGALDKYTNTYSYKYISGEKYRNQQTGEITGYELLGNPYGLSVMIVDDICDGGATFIMLSKALLKAGAKEVNLFVSHGLFTKGTKELVKAGINRIFTKEGELIL